MTHYVLRRSILTMHVEQRPSNSPGDTPFDQSKRDLDTQNNAIKETQSTDGTITGMRLTFIVAALLSAMFLVALVSFHPFKHSQPVHEIRNLTRTLIYRIEQSSQQLFQQSPTNSTQSATLAGMPALTFSPAVRHNFSGADSIHFTPQRLYF